MSTTPRRGRPTPPPRPTGTDVFADRKPAVANMRLGAAPPPPTAAPSAAAFAEPATTAPAAPEPVPAAEGNGNATGVPAPDAPAQPPRDAQAEPPRSTSNAPVQTAFDQQRAPLPSTELQQDAPLAASERDQLDLLINEVVSAAQTEPDSAAAVASRIADLTGHSEAALSRLMAAIVHVPSGGKVPTPLEIAPQLHEHVKNEVAANRRRNMPSTQTSVVLAAIGEAHESGRLAALAAAHKAGEKQNVPLFGRLTVGTAPRGSTVRLQFTPDSTPKLMTEILTAWHRIPLVVLVRLVLEDRYKRTRKTREVAEAEPAGVGS